MYVNPTRTPTINDRATEQSRKMFAVGRTHAPGRVNSFTRATDPPLVITRAQGAYLYDADGNKYIDYHAAFGPIILVHCHPAVNRAVVEAIAKVDLVGIGSTEFEFKLTARILEHVPSAEMVHPCNTGTDATYDAVRLARAITGRKKPLKFQGCFRHSHDYLRMNIITPAERVGKSNPGSAGMLPEAVQNTLIAEFNNFAEVERIVENEGHDLAAVILETIAHNIGCVVAENAFLGGLRRLMRERQIILIFDEVITGFPHAMGGIQALYGITPDLTTPGKSIANGFPCAALCGKRELMKRFNAAGGEVIFAGTSNGSPVSAAAALITIAELEDGAVHRRIFSLGDQIRQPLSAVIAEVRTKAFVAGFGSVFVIYFMDPPAHSYTDLLRNDSATGKVFRSCLMESGIMVTPYPLKRSHISASHSGQDIGKTVATIRSSLIKVRNAHA